MKKGSVFKWFTTISATVIFIIFTCFGFSAPSWTKNPNSFCDLISTKPEILEQINKINKSSLETNLGFFAAGSDRIITISPTITNNRSLTNSQAQNESIIYCAYLIPAISNLGKTEDFKPVIILSAIDIPNTNQKQLTVQFPELGIGWHRKNLIVVGSSETQLAQTPTSATTSPTVNFVGITTVLFSDFLTSSGIALLSLFFFYYLACLAGQKSRQKPINFGKLFVNPVALTSGHWGKASLTLFLFFVFTLIVLSRTVYILSRYGLLSGLSNDVLLLLGVIAAGAGGSKLLSTTKKRLSFENWAWLRQKKWLTAAEKGWKQEPTLDKAKWGDLIKVDGFFDVYSFQLLTFSIIIALNLILGIGGDLATFTFPLNYATLLGLSNVFYLGGKALDPASFEELDQSLTKLREIEDKLLNGSKTEEEIKSQIEYRKYLELAYPVAEMLRSLFGESGTFDGDKINEEKLKPGYPSSVSLNQVE